MLESMTGFSESSDRSGSHLIQVSFKSVNGKFLNISIKCNRQCIRIEEEAYRVLKSSFERGTITAVITLKADPLSTIRFDSLAEKIRDIPEEFQPVNAEIGSLVRAVSGNTEQDDIPDDVIERTSVLIRSCAEQLRQSRQKEGAELEAEINLLLDRIDAGVSTIRESSSDIEKRLRTRLTDSINELLGPQLQLNEADLAKEIALRCEKADIREETERLMIHIKSFRDTINANEASGKKLNFLCQELHREINTMGVKIMDTSFASEIIDLKTDIEKLKEQVQNVQ